MLYGKTHHDNVSPYEHEKCFGRRNIAVGKHNWFRSIIMLLTEKNMITEIAFESEILAVSRMGRRAKYVSFLRLA